MRALELRYPEVRNLKLGSEEPAKPGFQLVLYKSNSRIYKHECDMCTPGAKYD